MDTHKSDQVVKSIGKTWVNIQQKWQIIYQKPRKKAVSNFRLKTGHDCTVEYLNRIGILTSNVYQICNLIIMNARCLHERAGLYQDYKRRGEIDKLYWNARTYMNSL